MGLWSRFVHLFIGVFRVFSAREMEFNRKKLEGEIVKHSSHLFDYRSEQSHKVFSDYVRSLLNLEILKLSELKPTTLDAFAYQRGRIDALRQVLDLREKFILDKKEERKTGEEGSRRSYVRQPATSAGLSI